MNNNIIPNGNILDVEHLGQLVRQVRKSQGLTQEDLSAIAGIGPRLIGEVERGKETAEIGKVFQLLKILGLTISVEPRNIKNWRE